MVKFYNNIYSLKFTEVKKNHEDWLDLVTDKDLSVYTFRDVRNCCASMMRRDGMDEKNFLHARYYSPETFILSLISQDEKMRKTTEKAILSLKKGHVDKQITDLQEEIKEGTIDAQGIQILSQLTQIKTQISKSLGRNVG